MQWNYPKASSFQQLPKNVNIRDMLLIWYNKTGFPHDFDGLRSFCAIKERSGAAAASRSATTVFFKLLVPPKVSLIQFTKKHLQVSISDIFFRMKTGFLSIL